MAQAVIGGGHGPTGPPGFPLATALVSTRGGVEDTRLEAKAKDTKKSKAKDSLSEGRHSRGQGQECSRPRPRTEDTSASALQKKKVITKIFQAISKKKKVFTKIFQAISTKKRFPKNFSSTPQNFNNSKISAVLELRTGQFSRTRGQGQELDLRGQGQGLQNVSSRTPPLVSTFEKVLYTANVIRSTANFIKICDEAGIYHYELIGRP